LKDDSGAVPLDLEAWRALLRERAELGNRLLPPAETPITDPRRLLTYEGTEQQSAKSSGLPKAEAIQKAQDPNYERPQRSRPGRRVNHTAEERYLRYVFDRIQEQVPEDSILEFGEWYQKHGKVAETGGRPGRSGGSEQVEARKQLAETEGLLNTEKVRLGNNFPDMINPESNASGWRDYFEVGEMLKSGIPESRERAKLVQEIQAMNDNDTVTFVDKTNITRRIIYRKGDDVETKRVGQ
jgi:hypothetical protein